MLHRARVLKNRATFKGSGNFWEENYVQGCTSGDGSYGHLAEFKAKVLNGFVAEHQLQSFVELGCGDGNQLSLANYPSYLGYDVSPTALELCRKRFANDPTKRFELAPSTKIGSSQAQVAISLDVIYHLVEDKVFELYMTNLFTLAEEFVIVYSSDHNNNPRLHHPFILHREFTPWVAKNAPEWRQSEKIGNDYPFEGDSATGSHSDFYVYERRAQ
ncbi:MAG: class I SAM-dependent methyltransferase [Proteobacteria bacterium]|nr:class I SAM-dependent methyltransferase [Pseudomonadota bacterium]